MSISCSCILAIAIAASALAQQSGDTTPLPFDSAVVKGKLPNGLTYYIRKNGKPEHRAELRLVVNAGSVLEDEDQRGLAHVLEHTAFRGTARFPKKQLINFLESVGMRFGPDVNAYTDFDETVFMLQVPTDTAAILEKGIEILADWSHAISFDPTSVDTERNVVIEEWRLGRGAGARMRDKIFPVLFKDSRYAVRLPIGDVNTLRTFKLETLKRFYQRWYRPDLMAVIVVGDCDPKTVQDLITREFSPISNPPTPADRVYYPVPDHREPLYTIATDSEATISQVTVYTKHSVRDQSTEGAYRRSLIENLYSSMFNQRLGELARKSDPPYVYGFTGNEQLVRTKESYFLQSAVKDSGIERGLQTLLTEAARVRKYGFSASELDRIKNDMLRSVESAFLERDKTESENYADEYIRNFLQGEPSSGIAYEFGLYKKLIPSITLEDVNGVSSEWITDSNRVVAVTAPSKKTTAIPTIGELRSIFESVNTAEITPYVDTVSAAPLVENLPSPGTLVKTNERPTLGVSEWLLSNGIRVILKPTDFKNDEVTFSAFSPGGTSTAADSDFIAASTATTIVEQGGIASFDLVTLEKKLSGKLVNVSPSIDELDEGMSGSSSVKDLETMFQLIYLYFTAPREDSSAFLSLKSRFKGVLENRSADPRSAFGDTVEVTLAQHHPRREPWSVETIDKLNLHRSYEIYKQLFADAGNFTFVFVGSFKSDQIKPFILQYLGSLPNLHSNRMWKDIGVRPPKGIIEKSVFRGAEPKSEVRIIFSGPLQHPAKSRYGISALAEVLRIKLREAMREDKGATYYVSVSPQPEQKPDSEYTFTISFGCAPEKVDDLTKTAFSQIDSVKKFGVGDLYITKVKEAERRERETSLKENGFWLNHLRFYYSNDEDPEQMLNFDKLVASLSSDGIKQWANKYLDMNNYIHAALYPAKSETKK
ncbi:MAG TPA: insulinase family protein [Bacteroidota bacterium]|nr:insulinase family protein [Bacteroidota bacterium]